MAQDLTTSSTAALPAVDTTEPSTILSLPAWLASQLTEVSDLGAGRTVVDPVTREIIARVPTIPKSRMPTGPQRRAIERRITELQDALWPGPEDATLMHLGDLIKEYAATRIDADTVAIKASAYLDAVGDLPAWAVREAIRRWRRGEVDADAQALEFAPRPAKLKAIADRIVMVAKGQAGRLQRILDAEAAIELSDAEAAENLRKIYAAGRPSQDMMSPPVGTAHADRLAAQSHLQSLKTESAA